MLNITKIVLLSILFLVAFKQFAQAENDVIKDLTASIASAQSEEDKSRLHMYRARNYKNFGDNTKAEEDYNAALSFDHKGWIHLERARFYLSIGDFSQAKKDAAAAQKETPTLKFQADKIIAIAKRHDKKITKEEPAKEILLTSKWEVNRRQVTMRPQQQNIRQRYAANNKAKVRSRPRRVARS